MTPLYADLDLDATNLVMACFKRSRGRMQFYPEAIQISQSLVYGIECVRGGGFERVCLYGARV